MNFSSLNESPKNQNTDLGNEKSDLNQQNPDEKYKVNLDKSEEFINIDEFINSLNSINNEAEVEKTEGIIRDNASAIINDIKVNNPSLFGILKNKFKNSPLDIDLFDIDAEPVTNGVGAAKLKLKFGDLLLGLVIAAAALGNLNSKTENEHNKDVLHSQSIAKNF
jgi:hypothetical protein